jgi:ATP-dependent Clp protease ATP-binding subunit ClpC
MTLIVMTSNLGAAATRVGFSQAGSAAPDTIKAIEQHFRPEFFNRLDVVVPFANLEPHDIRRIVRLELDKLGRREGLVRRNIQLCVSEAAEQHLAEQGFHPKFGARPLTRVIEERVMTPIAVELAKHPKLNNVRVEVDYAANELSVTFRA